MRLPSFRAPVIIFRRKVSRRKLTVSFAVSRPYGSHEDLNIVGPGALGGDVWLTWFETLFFWQGVCFARLRHASGALKCALSVLQRLRRDI